MNTCLKALCVSAIANLCFAVSAVKDIPKPPGSSDVFYGHSIFYGYNPTVVDADEHLVEPMVREVVKEWLG